MKAEHNNYGVYGWQKELGKKKKKKRPAFLGRVMKTCRVSRVTEEFNDAESTAWTSATLWKKFLSTYSQYLLCLQSWLDFFFLLFLFRKC